MEHRKDVVAQLVEVSSKFYAIDVPTSPEVFVGKIDYYNILKNKIDVLMSGIKTPWSLVIESLANITSLTLNNMDFMQFPAYTASFELENVKSGNTSFKRSLVFSVSLLCDRYTVFIEDEFLYFSYASLTGSPAKKIISLQSTIRENEMSLTESVKELIEKHFSNYEFIEHTKLFIPKIKNSYLYSQGEPVERGDHCLYSLLFDSFYNTDSLSVCA